MLAHTSPTSLAVNFDDEQGTAQMRSVGKIIHAGRLAIPPLSPQLQADWSRDLDGHLQAQPGDVESLSLPRARRKWQGFAQCVRLAQVWLDAHLPGFDLADASVALMACRGARYHHDACQYGGAAFLNLFVTDELDLEVHFPLSELRVSLQRGTILLFDPAQPHAVVPRGADGFDKARFTDGPPLTQVFLTWELPVEHGGLDKLLGVCLDNVEAMQGMPHGLWLDGQLVEPCPSTGRLLPA